MSPEREISAALARHVASLRFEDLPATTIAATKRALLDGLGVMLAASGLSEDVRPFVTLAREMAGPCRASILGSWERVSPAAAAFANGAMAHALDYEDAFDAAPTHPTASLIPAALAMAQALDARGATFITAMAIGCDLACRLALSVGDALERAWYPPPILGAFGAVAATAHLHGLTEQQTLDAFSLMLCQTTCPQEIKHSRDSVIRAVREAFPAQAAVISAALAAQDVRGFATPLEGKGGFFHAFADGRWNADALLHDLGRHFYIEALSFKPWPCCRGTHPYIEAAQRLRAAHGIRPQDIKLIRAPIGTVQQMLCEPLARKRAPATIIDAKFSIPFTVGAAFVHQEVTLDTFTTAQIVNPEVLAIAARVAPFVREGSPTSGGLEIELTDGRRYASEIDQALGHPDRPMTDARLRGKFVDCATRAAVAMTVVEAQELCDRILSLELDVPIERALSLPSRADASRDFGRHSAN
jgi:2-methylcitrate dehydratase PrpD